MPLTYQIMCTKDGFSLCQPQPRKTPGGICGAKWWCYTCKRYVLPDKNHVLLETGTPLRVGTITFREEE